MAFPHSTAHPNDVKQAPHSAWPCCPLLCERVLRQMVRTMANGGLRGPGPPPLREGQLLPCGTQTGTRLWLGCSHIFPGLKNWKGVINPEPGGGGWKTSYFTAAFTLDQIFVGIPALLECRPEDCFGEKSSFATPH